MEYFLQSIRTVSYWKYALWSADSVKTFFAVIGGGWAIIGLLEFLHIYERQQFPKSTIWILVVIAIFCVLITRRPASRIFYKVPGRDLKIEVRVASLFGTRGQKVISTNTTFDTDIAGGIISAQSVQGQFTNHYYGQNIEKLNEEIEHGLGGRPYVTVEKERGKHRQYPIGTTVKLKVGTDQFYWVAMADMNYYNTAETSLDKVLAALDGLWNYIATQGEMDDVVLPLIGTGRGRLDVGRMRMIAHIAQSFVKASTGRIFTNKLVIVIRTKDVENFGINLFAVRDLLSHYLG